MTWLFIVLVIIILIFFNALYVSAEFSTVSSRRARLNKLSSEGNLFADALISIVEDSRRLDTYVATCQLGITVSSLVLGFYGQAQISELITPWVARWGDMSQIAANSISATAILVSLTSLQVLLGELVPKNIGIQYPEKLAILTFIPMRWSTFLFKPLIWLFNGSGQLIMKLLGLNSTSEHTHIHAPQEIVILAEESKDVGLLNQEELRLLKNTLEMRESMVRQLMIPRTKMFAAPSTYSWDKLLALIADSPFSRLPLYKGSKDNIIGVVHLKDLLCLDQETQLNQVSEIIRPVVFVPETMPAKTVFNLLQRKHIHIAIILDEFGGTAGMVSLEDLIEEIFGEFQDEFDIDQPQLRLISNNRLWIRGDTLVEELNERLDTVFPKETVDTIGGLLLNTFGYVPKVGQKIGIKKTEFRVEEMSGRGIAAVSMEVTPGQINRLQERGL